MSKLSLSALTQGILSYTAERLGTFWRKVTSKEIGSHTPTGFAALDEFIGGGLRSGLYILMAVPGAGKTTLAMQIMDNIAIGGRDVIFFSAEMRVDDLMAKLLSRHSLKTARPMDSNEILALGNRPDAVPIAEELSAIYHPYAEHTIIVPRDQIDSLKAVERMLQEYQEATGQTPVVIIDYLQQLAAKFPAGTDKQAVDAVLTEIVAKGIDELIDRINTWNCEFLQDDEVTGEYREQFVKDSEMLDSIFDRLGTRNGYPIGVPTVKELIAILRKLPEDYRVYCCGGENHLYLWSNKKSITIDCERYLSGLKFQNSKVLTPIAKGVKRQNQKPKIGVRT